MRCGYLAGWGGNFSAAPAPNRVRFPQTLILKQIMTLSKAFVEWLEVDEDQAGQRLDNFLQGYLKGVPKSHVYRLLRSGEVRVNSKRADPSYRLQRQDRLRIPPVRRTIPEKEGVVLPLPISLRSEILHEDEGLLVLNKPAGVAVHGGSGIRLGVIEQLRQDRPEARFLELVHRLDRDTSGLLLVAKKRAVLVALHESLRHNRMEKSYLALVQGQFPQARQHVRLPLHKYMTASGERRVVIHAEGKPSETLFTRLRTWPEATLLEARLLTGRTHQIRVHLAHLGFPIAGDDKYGNHEWNHQLTRLGLKRMFLHAARLSFVHPLDQRSLVFEAPLPPALIQILTRLTGSGEEPLPAPAGRVRQKQE